MIWRLTRDLSKASIMELMKKKPALEDYTRPKFICPICNKNCGNAGLLAMHMKSPGRPYREIHRKYELNKKWNAQYVIQVDTKKDPAESVVMLMI